MRGSWGGAALRDALEQELDGADHRRLTARVAALSQSYRRYGAPPGRLTPEDALAYAVFRLPATYAATAAAFAQAAEVRPAFAPRSLLDVGSGPATALWAAAAIWPSLEDALLLVEREPVMRTLGQRLQAASDHPAVRAGRWQRGDLALGVPAVHADLVVAAYVLGELDAAALSAVTRALWSVTADTLVVIEPGTPDGFARVRAVRHELGQLGGAVSAPCPHDAPCPLGPGDWCHFGARLGRSRLQRQAKGAALPFEDEKYAFVAVGRSARAARYARVLRRPVARPGHVQLRLCTPSGLAGRTVARSDKGAYRLARDVAWGGRMPWPDAPNGEPRD